MRRAILQWRKQPSLFCCTWSRYNSRWSSSQPEWDYRVLSTLQNIFISHQIYSSLITKSGNAHLLDQIPLYVLPSSLVIQRSHALLRICSSAPVSCFVVSSCNIINLLSLISTYYRAETLPPWVFFCLSHHAADRFVLSTFLRLSPNCKHPSFFERFWLICTNLRFFCSRIWIGASLEPYLWL